MRVHSRFASVLLLIVGLALVPTLPAAGQEVTGALPVGEQPMLTLTTDVQVMAWPIPNAEVLGALPAQSSVPTSGRTQDSLWWQIPYPTGPNGSAWLSSTGVVSNTAAAGVPVYVVLNPAPAPAPTPPPPEPAPAPCQNSASFVADITIPDNTVVAAGQPLDKVWRLVNTGTCSWGVGTVLAFVGGYQMGGQAAVPVPPTPPGAQGDLSAPLMAPVVPGTFTGVWQLRSPDGQMFGPQLTVVVQVPGIPTPPAPTPPPAPGPTINFWADSTQVNANQCTNLHWDVENVQAVYLEYGGRSRGVVGQGSQQVCPSRDGNTYLLQVMLTNGSEQSRQININVNTPPVQIQFTSDRSRITIGECTTLRWRVDNAARVQFNDGTGGWQDVRQQENRQVCPAYPTTYHLLVTDLAGQQHDRTVGIKTQAPPPGLLTPTPAPPPQRKVSIDFTSDRREVTIGECTTVRWKVKNGGQVEFSDGSSWQVVGQQDSRQVCPAYPTTYQLQVTDLDGQNHDRSVSISTKAPPGGLIMRGKK